MSKETLTLWFWKSGDSSRLYSWAVATACSSRPGNCDHTNSSGSPENAEPPHLLWGNNISSCAYHEKVKGPQDFGSLTALCRITRPPLGRTLYPWHPCLVPLLALALWARSAASLLALQEFLRCLEEILSHKSNNVSLALCSVFRPARFRSTILHQFPGEDSSIW